MKCFCVDIDASKTAELLGFNRKTINRYYKIFREAVTDYQNLEKNKIVGIVEVDESYFGRSRIEGVPGLKLRSRAAHNTITGTIDKLYLLAPHLPEGQGREQCHGKSSKQLLTAYPRSEAGWGKVLKKIS